MSATQLIFVGLQILFFLILYALLYPKLHPVISGIEQKPWSKDKTEGYRIGLLGATVIIIGIYFINLFVW